MLVSLRKKTLFIVGLTLLGLIIVLFVSSNSILLTSYQQLEDRDVRENVQRTLNAIRDELDNLSATNRDYSDWDDTYAFIKGENQNYIQNNMTDSTLVGLDLDFMVFVDSENRVVFSKTVGLTDTEQQFLADKLKPDSALLNYPNLENMAQGILMVGGEAALLSSHPILTSESKGPIAGTLVVGKLLNETRIERLSNSLQLSMTFVNVDGPNLPEGFQRALTVITSSAPVFVAPTNQTTVTGYSVIADLEQRPAIILGVDRVRNIYAQGQNSLSYFLVIVVIIGLVFMLVTLLLLERMVLSRLSYLNKQVTQITKSSTPSIIKGISGQDEISNLAEAINRMLEALAQTSRQLQEANRELENRVQERTIELAHARDQAMESLRLKAQILANVSHDARTPLNIITLRTEMMQQGRYGPTTPKQNEALEGILSSARQLLAFMNNLLEEARFDRKKAKVVESEIQLRQFLDEILSSVRPLAEKKGLVIESNLDPNLPTLILADPYRLKQILANLLDNAIKFTRQGLIGVKVHRADATHWELQVSDSGIGIPVEAQSHIFEAFWQVDGSITREANRGVGLGLSIVKQLVNLMNGTMTVYSEPDHGSTFTVVLPLKLAAQAGTYEPT